MALPALLAAGAIGFVLGVIGNEEDRKQREAAKKAALDEESKKHEAAQKADLNTVEDFDDEDLDDDYYDDTEEEEIDEKPKFSIEYDIRRRAEETEEQRSARISALYAVCMNIGCLDDEYDIDDSKVDQTVASAIKEAIETNPNFEAAKTSFLDKVRIEELKELDEIVKKLVFMSDERNESRCDFYAYKWKPYFDSRIKNACIANA